MVIRYIFVILAFIVDGILSMIFPAGYVPGSLYFIPCFGLCALVLNIRKISLVDGMIMSILMGMFYDFVYADTYLLYAIIFAIVCIVINIWTRHLGSSLPESIVICSAAIFIKELTSYLVSVIVYHNSLPVLDWLGNRIFLTILVNTFLVCLVYFFNTIKDDLLRNRDLQTRRQERIFLYRGGKR